MAACRFRVSHVSEDSNAIGQKMRLIRMTAVSGDAFYGGEPSENQSPPAFPRGEISILVNVAFAKKFAVGDEFNVVFSEK